MHMALQPDPDRHGREMISPQRYIHEGCVGMGQCCFGRRSRILTISSAANKKVDVSYHVRGSKSRPTLPPRELKLLRTMQHAKLACMVSIYIL